MQSCEWVLDTWVLKTAISMEHGKQWDSLSLLLEIEKKHKIALDQKGEIEKEYRRYYTTDLLLKKWWKLMITRTGKISHKTGHIPQRTRKRLINDLAFHHDDVKFVDVAYQTDDKFLVSEDSDYTDTIKNYLKDELGISCLQVAEALAKAREP